jgi:hypothetical protein
MPIAAIRSSWTEQDPNMSWENLKLASNGLECLKVIEPQSKYTPEFKGLFQKWASALTNLLPSS